MNKMYIVVRVNDEYKLIRHKELNPNKMTFIYADRSKKECEKFLQSL